MLLGACGGGDGASAESWCDFVTESDAVNDVFDSLSTDSAEAEAGLKIVEGFVERLPDEAPSEIAADAKVLADGTQMVIDAVAAADFSVIDADLSFMQDGDLEARLETAEDNMDVYTEKECGRPFGTGATDEEPADEAATDDSESGETGTSEPEDFDPGAGTIREQMIAQFESLGLSSSEADCLASNLDFNDPAVQTGDITAMFAVFEECGIDPTQLGGSGD